MGLARHGLADKEIAGRLHLGESEVRTEWTALRTALGASNRAHAVALALRGDAEGPARAAGLEDALCEGRLCRRALVPGRGEAYLDEQAGAVLGLDAAGCPMPLPRLLGLVWEPDRRRFARYLEELAALRPMTPIECRVGPPGSRDRLVSTVNLAYRPGRDGGAALLATALVERLG